MIASGDRRGREFIIVDDWGPYDFKSPKLWPAIPDRIDWIDAARRFPLGGLGARRDTAAPDAPIRLRVLGPEGSWKAGHVVGGSLSAQGGRVPGEVTFTPARGAADQRIDVIYTGAEVLTPRGRRIPAGEPYTFSFHRFDPPVDWTVRWFVWTESADPLTAPDAFRKVLAGTPLKTGHPRRLDHIGGRAFTPDVPADRVAMIAEGKVMLPPGPAGAYELRVISDDGVKVWVDGTLAIDNWDVHGSELDTAAISGGAHTLRVEYFEATGWAEFRLEFAPRRARNR